MLKKPFFLGGYKKVLKIKYRATALHPRERLQARLRYPAFTILKTENPSLRRKTLTTSTFPGLIRVIKNKLTAQIFFYIINHSAF